MTTATGTLSPAGDRWQLRFTRELAHPAEKVWRAITEPEHLEAWFPDTLVGRLEPGAALRFETGMEGIEPFDGEVLAMEPPALLELRWGTDHLRFEIAPRGDGACTLTLTDTFDEQGKAARDGAGWHVCLDKLEHDLDGTRPGWEDGDHWRDVHPRYVADLGPEAATIGPPAGALD